MKVYGTEALLEKDAKIKLVDYCIIFRYIKRNKKI